MPKTKPQEKTTRLPVARRRSDISSQRLAALNAGHAQTATLIEALALDFSALLASAFPDCADQGPFLFPPGLSVLRRMEGAGRFLASSPHTERFFAHAAGHSADTVRGWAAYALRTRWENGLDLADALRLVKPVADDSHFGVREWAWLALRPAVLADLRGAFALLMPWSQAPSANLRRFAVEILRPRGVWCAHASLLKSDPSIALPLLAPLRSDPSLYVRKSVANWLNDAAKSTPEWVDSLCTEWEQEKPTPQTLQIVRRARRSFAASSFSSKKRIKTI